jgi:hypothetical protein
LMAKKLHEIMLEEVKNNSFEMAMQMIKGENPFSDSILDFAQKVSKMAEIMSYFDTSRHYGPDIKNHPPDSWNNVEKRSCRCPRHH